uniref:Replication protein A subunit n=1 Tax=Kalanchoe fedtschenkoi TaxID=63787 RepID=A0A7N0ZYF7_KALFE
MVEQLTEGAILMMSKNPPEDLKPVMQIVDLKMVNTSQSAVDRYRVMLSDGIHVQQGMLATQKNHLVSSGIVKKWTVVRLDQFVVNHVQTRMIIIICEISVLADMSELIGNPKPVITGNGDSASGPTAPNLAAGSVQSPRMDSNSASSYSSNADTGRYSQAHGSGSYGYHSSGVQRFRADVPRAPMNSYGAPTNSYGRPSQPAYQQPPPMYSNRGPVAKNEAPARIIPIAALTPYMGRWTIKARVTAKGELRHYNNTRGDGKVFSFDLLDSDGGEIRVTCFNAVADQFYDIIVPGRVYLISKGSLKLAQKNFNHLCNDHEIFLESSSTVVPCDEDDTSIPKQQFHFCAISDIESKDSNSIVDVIGVVSSVSPLSSIMRKNGTETQKRALQLKDMSGRSVEVTLWGGFCTAEGQTLQNMCDAGDFPVLALKAGRVGDFSGKSLGTISTSQLLIEPDFPEAHRLKEWYYKEGRSAPVVSISREPGMGRMDARKTISQIKSERLGTSEKPDWITVSASICFVKLDNFCYTACPLSIGDRQCSKKVTNNGDGKFKCERCEQTIDECDYRYILQFQIQDHTGLTYVTAFQECAEELLGISAKELFYLKNEQHDDEKCAEIIHRVLFERYLFKLKVKEETYSDESRVKSTVVKAEKLNYNSEFKHLLDSLSKLKGEDSSPTGTGVKAHNMGLSPGTSNTFSGAVGVKRPPPPVTDYLGGGGNYGRESGTPTKPRTQYGGNQYTGSVGSGGGGFMSCSGCGSTGHTSANCPSIMSAPSQAYDTGYLNRGSTATAGNVAGECYKCHKLGHLARDCPGVSHVPPAYGSGGGFSSSRY